MPVRYAVGRFPVGFPSRRVVPGKSRTRESCMSMRERVCLQLRQRFEGTFCNRCGSCAADTRAGIVSIALNAPLMFIRPLALMSLHACCMVYLCLLHIESCQSRESPRGPSAFALGLDSCHPENPLSFHYWHCIYRVDVRYLAEASSDVISVRSVPELVLSCSCSL